jgi:hypothetical protein
MLMVSSTVHAEGLTKAQVAWHVRRNLDADPKCRSATSHTVGIDSTSIRVVESPMIKP